MTASPLRPLPQKTIGVLGGMSDAATADYYRLINARLNARSRRLGQRRSGDRVGQLRQHPAFRPRRPVGRGARLPRRQGRPPGGRGRRRGDLRHQHHASRRRAHHGRAGDPLHPYRRPDGRGGPRRRPPPRGPARHGADDALGRDGTALRRAVRRRGPGALRGRHRGRGPHRLRRAGAAGHPARIAGGVHPRRRCLADRRCRGRDPRLHRDLPADRPGRSARLPRLRHDGAARGGGGGLRGRRRRRRRSPPVSPEGASPERASPERASTVRTMPPRSARVAIPPRPAARIRRATSPSCPCPTSKQAIPPGASRRGRSAARAR